ncbi:MAG: IS3 family transposase, partial [Candidatus Kapabacteria bacterium]|nr:IS3 family transposase [Candidatus Kapabacteria bacterium]
MKERGLKAKTRCRFRVTTNSDHKLNVAPNLLQSMPKPDEPDQVHVADITYIWTREGWLYLSMILDL